MTDRFDTAHVAWDQRWDSETGRSDWLEPEAVVRTCAERLYAQGARSALDLGCGVGRHALMLASMGFTTTALDGAPKGLEHLQEEARRSGLSIETRLGLMTELPFEDDAFDFVLSFNVIYHGDPAIVRQAIAEIGRVLRPGGTYQGTMLSKRNTHFQSGIEVAPDTWILPGETDKDHPHFYCNAAELVALFDGFELMYLEDREHSRAGSWHWHMIAQRLG